jgi:protein-S-isoprenylcysteine O-methyltransferase Ste14
MIEYLIIIGSVALFGLQHSGVSALRVKNRIIDRWGKQGYANIYNVTSVITIGVAFLSMWFWDWFYFILDPSSIQLLLFLPGLGLIAIGIAVALLASRVISVSTVADMRTDRMSELVTDGIYARVRHPLYLATILLLLGLGLLYPFPVVTVFVLSLCVYVLIGSYFEEKKLITHYGQAYLDYKQQAGFIIPKV